MWADQLQSNKSHDETRNEEGLTLTIVSLLAVGQAGRQAGRQAGSASGGVWRLAVE